MRYDHLLVDLDGTTATVKLDRPDVRNALDDETIAELTDCFTQLSKRPGKGKLSRGVLRELRSVVLAGTGPVFCAGADLRWMRRAAGYSVAENRRDANNLLKMYQAVDSCPVPVVARVQGGVYGGALGLLAACDAVVAAEDAKFCFSEVRLGILPAVIATFVLDKIGPSHTRKLFMSSEVFGAALAQRIGLVHEVCAPEALDETVKDLVEGIGLGGPDALALCKEYLRQMGDAGSRDARLKLSVKTLVKARSSPEGKEGLSAFLEKRKPSWRA